MNNKSESVINNTRDMSKKSENNTSVCANCGKGEEASVNLKSCTACKLVKYCNRDCQIAHRPQHKKECKKRAKELHEIELFKQPPPLEDCPICMVRLPSIKKASTYMTCCGKVICTGCIYAVQLRAAKARRREDDVCPFCRTPPPTEEESSKRVEKRIDFNDAIAICCMGGYYFHGSGIAQAQDYTKALELWHRAAELGSTESYYNIGNAYRNGRGVDADEKKAIHYYKPAAMGGDVEARHYLGCFEVKAGNHDKALKHWMIAVKDGDFHSLQGIEHLCSAGFATKDDHAKALQSYQAYIDEIKTAQRDEAAVFNDGNRYYDLA